LRIDWVREAGALEPIAAGWRALEGAVRRRTHVSTFDFLAPWYRHYAGAYGGSPLIGLAWQGTELAGVAPLTIRRGRLGRIPVTRVDFAPNDSIAGEFLAGDDQPEIVAALLDSLVQQARFDVICLNGFDPASAQLLEVQHAAGGHRLAVHTEEHAYAMVDLTGGYERYRAGLTRRCRGALNQKARKVDAAVATVEGVQPGDDRDRIEASINRMIAITEASYKLQGQRLADRHRAFLGEIARRFGARHMLSLPILTIGGRDAAFILGVVERGCFYDVTLAYDDSFAKLSPGAYLMQATLQRLAATGISTVISHGAHEYKRHWATAFVPQHRVFLFPRRPRATAARVVRFGVQPLWGRLTARAAAPANVTRRTGLFGTAGG